MKIKEIKDLLKSIEKKKNVIAKERDGLRKAYNEIGALLESLDDGIEALEAGKGEIESGIDSISEVV